MATKKIDFTHGELFNKIFVFVLPIITSGILQNLYHSADMAVLRFSDDTLALAAIGSSGSITTFIINICISLSVGCGIVISQARGRQDYITVKKAIHTAISLALMSGVTLMLLGLIIARPALTLMGTKDELMERAVLYMQIRCLGIPASALYNFLASSMRSLGDSKTSLKILSASGLLNVGLNFVFVMAFSMASDGVALATIISQYASAATMLTIMMRNKNEPYAVELKSLRIDKDILKTMFRFGIPSAIQSSMFSISGVFLTSATNMLTTVDISAKTIAFNISNIINTAMSAYTHASVTATAQNFGAKNLERIKKSVKVCALQSLMIGTVMSCIVLIFHVPLINIFVGDTDPNRTAIIQAAKILLFVITPGYGIVGVMNSLSGALRGIGHTTEPMVISIICVCILRIIWFNTVFLLPAFHSGAGLFAVYPTTWVIASSVLGIALIPKLKKILPHPSPTEPASTETAKVG